MKVDDLLLTQNGFYVDDCVIFRVEMTVYGELEVVGKGASSHSVTLSQCFSNMLTHPVHADVALLVGDPPQTIYAHKYVLMARSPVFYAMFSHDMKENVSGEVHINDFEPVVVQELLNFIYTDSLSSSSTEIPQHDLLRIAAKYQVPDLMSICEQSFTDNLNSDSVVAVLQMAQDYGAMRLKISCLQFIAHSAPDIIKQAAFQELDSALVNEATTLIDAVGKRKSCNFHSSPATSSLHPSNVRSTSTCTVM